MFVKRFFKRFFMSSFVFRYSIMPDRYHHGGYPLGCSEIADKIELYVATATSVAQAVQGTVGAPFVIAEDYVWAPPGTGNFKGGHVDFVVKARTATAVEVECEVARLLEKETCSCCHCDQRGARNALKTHSVLR